MSRTKLESAVFLILSAVVSVEVYSRNAPLSAPNGGLWGGVDCAIEIPGICWGFTEGPCSASPCQLFSPLDENGELIEEQGQWLCRSKGLERRYYLYESCSSYYVAGAPFKDCEDDPFEITPSSPQGQGFCFQQQACAEDCVPDGDGVMMCANGNGVFELSGSFIPSVGVGTCFDDVTQVSPQNDSSGGQLQEMLGLASFR